MEPNEAPAAKAWPTKLIFTVAGSVISHCAITTLTTAILINTRMAVVETTLALQTRTVERSIDEVKTELRELRRDALAADHPPRFTPAALSHQSARPPG